MLGFSVDISPILEVYAQVADRSSEFKQVLLDRLTDEYMFHWEGLVGQELKSTRGEYLSAINTERDGDEQVFMIMPTQSGLPIGLEDGKSAWDIKAGMETSPKKTTTEAGGWYITVPMRQGTEDTVGESVGKPMPKQIQKVASAMKQGESLKLSNLPEQYQKLLTSKSGYEHKNPIYQGLTKTNIQSTQNEKRSGYVTFRRISDNSDENSWEHPGFEAHKFMDRTMDWLLEERASQIIDEVTEEFLNSI